MAKKFNKEKWLERANKQVASGILTQKDVDHALEVWVNDLDGKEVDDEVNSDWCDSDETEEIQITETEETM